MVMFGHKVSRSRVKYASTSVRLAIEDYDGYMDEVMGLSPSTRYYRRRYSKEFLEWRFKGKRLETRRLSFEDIVRYVNFGGVFFLVKI